MERLWERIGEGYRSYGLVVMMAVLGVGLLGYGLWIAVRPSQVVVEIIDQGNRDVVDKEMGIIIVDVAGAVEQPGVYELESGSRIGEALALAGGLSAQADRGWVSRYVNMASELEDGMKVYVPMVSEGEGEIVDNNIEYGNDTVMGVSANQRSVNINTASISELDSLWGIGEARAQEIVTNRPYGSVEELMSKAGIPSNVFEKIQDQVSVY